MLELRIHGVSNTPPADLLGIAPKPGATSRPGDPQPELVAGDATTGFYRPSNGSDGAPLIEAYSWGQLTSGVRRAAKDVQRALWTLLLPFALSNVALHARPDIPADPEQETPGSDSGLTAWLIRVFCLSVTVTFVLTAVGVGVDLIAWQCVDKECLAQIPGPWEFLAGAWWHTAGRALVIGLLVPFGVLALIGFLAWRSYQYEAELPAMPPNPKDTAPPANPLQQATFWCGEGQLRRLAVIHLAVGAAVATLVPVGAMIDMDPPGGWRELLSGSTVVLLGAVVLLAVLALGRRYVTRRGGETRLGTYGWALIGLTAGGVVLGILYLLLPDPAFNPEKLRPPQRCWTDSTVPGCANDRSLPGYDWIVGWVGVVQILMLIAIAGVARSGRRALLPPIIAVVLMVGGNAWSADWLPGVGPSPAWLHTWQFIAPTVAAAAVVTLFLPRTGVVRGHADGGPTVRIAWGGRGPAVFAGFGWMLGMAYASGVLYWVTDVLNGGATPTGRSPITLPLPVMWTGLAIVVMLVVILVVAAAAGVAYLRYRRAGRRFVRDRFTRPGGGLSAHEERRARRAASFVGLHDLVGGPVLRLAGLVAVLGFGVVILGTSAALSGVHLGRLDVTNDLRVFVKALVDIGDRLANLLPFGIAGLGLLVYRSETVRRGVGVVWDIATFWPRSAHPLAPPCYAERAVPELQTRTSGLMRPSDQGVRAVDYIVVSAHSQGAVIAAALILQMGASWRERIWFLSHGCQLTRLYGRAFPAYFGRSRLAILGKQLTLAPVEEPRWTNFWRNTDPLGWEVAGGQGQLEVKDPEELRPSGGEIKDPPIRNHSGYPESREYQTERDRVVNLLLTRSTRP
ncbi:MAG: hypothetical protein ACRDT4_13070 [Micromonosporaceae bacterium]